MAMQLGIVVIDDRNAAHAKGLLKAAQERGWETRCFLTDRGVFLLQDPEFRQMLDESKSHFSMCELSIERYAGDGVSVAGLEDKIVVGGQYQNAELVHNCDQVLTF
jgi:hypothetical protein